MDHMHEFLSDSWLAAAEELTRAAGVLTDTRGVVTLSLDVTSSGEGDVVEVRFRDGAVGSWQRVESSSAETCFVTPPHTLRRLLDPAIDPIQKMKELRIAPSGEAPDLPPPLDGTTAALLQEMPMVEAGDLCLELRLTGGPFGPFTVFLVIEGGRPALVLDEPGREAAGVLYASLQSAMSYLCNDLDLFEFLEVSKVEGKWSQLMLAAGVVDSPGWRHAMEGRRAYFAYFSEVSGLFGSPGFREALGTLLKDQTLR